MAYLFIIIVIWLVALQQDYNEFKKEFRQFRKYLILQNSKNHACNKQNNTKENSPEENSSKEGATVENKVPIQSSPLDCINDKVEIKPQTFSPKPNSNSNYNPNSNLNFNFEKIFMENIFNKIGALAIIIGAGIFIKLISPYFILTPPMQITIVVLAGLGMIFGAFKLHKNEMKNYAEVLSGTGFAILFIATYFAGSTYELFSLPTTITIGFMLIVATFLVTEKFKTFSTVVIGLFGGYLNPFFVNSDISSNFLFGYLIFLNLISIIYVQKNPNKIALNIVNLVLTTITVSIFSYSRENVSLFYPLILWALYLIDNLLQIAKKENTLFGLQNFLAWLNYGALIWFANYVFQFANNNAVGITVLATGIIYLIGAYFTNKKANTHYNMYLYGFILSLLVSTYFLSTETIRVCLWAIEASVISFIAIKIKLKELENWGLTFLLASFVAIFFHENAINVYDIKNYIPIFNPRTILFFIPILSAYSCCQFLASTNEKLSKFYKFFYITLIYLFATFELNLILSKYMANYNYGENAIQIFCYSIIGFTYAINLKRLNEFSSNKIFETAGYTVYLIALIALIIAGFSSNFSIPILNIRFIAFVLAIATTLFYGKGTNAHIFEYLAIAIGACLIQTEAYGLLQKMPIGSVNILLSTASILYSGAIMLVGIFKNIKSLKIAGIWIMLITILKILFYDLNNVEPIFKTIAFILLGVILMAVSYFWVKNKKTN